MSAKEQYKTAYSAVRAIRRYNRMRVAYIGVYPYLEDKNNALENLAYAVEDKNNALENLAYAVEQHIMLAAVESIIMNKPQFSDTRSMSNRLLDDWKALSPVTQSDIQSDFETWLHAPIADDPAWLRLKNAN